MKKLIKALAVFGISLLLLLGIAATPPNSGDLSLSPSKSQAATIYPVYDHIVIVVEENKAGSKIIGDRSNAPYINSLADNGVSFSDFHANYHPSQPNYINLFSGSNSGVTSNNYINPKLKVANLGGQLIAKGKSVAGYSESMPNQGYEGDTFQNPSTGGWYKSKHNPVRAFADIPSSANKTFAQFPSDYNSLPTVSIVVPDQNNDMHDGSIKTGDTWLKNHMDGYAQWAKTHNSLLIVTWDEDDVQACSSLCTTGPTQNKVATVFYGANLKNGTVDSTAYPAGHRSILKMIETMYGLPFTTGAANAKDLTAPFNTTNTTQPPATPSAFWSDNATSTSAKLHWYLSSGATSYKIYQNGTLIYTAGGTETGLDLTNLIPSTYYHWQIVASNSAGNSAPHDAYLTTPNTGLSAPTAFWSNASEVTPTGTHLYWSQSAGATSYVIYQNNVKIYEGSGTNLILNNLTPSTYYHWKIYAKNQNSVSSDWHDAYLTTPKN